MPFLAIAQDAAAQAQPAWQFWLTLLTPIIVAVIGTLMMLYLRADRAEVAEKINGKDRWLDLKIDGLADSLKGVEKGIRAVEAQNRDLGQKFEAKNDVIHARVTDLAEKHSKLEGFVMAQYDNSKRRTGEGRG